MPKQKAQRRKATAPRKRVSRMIPPTVYSAWTTIGGWCLLTGMSPVQRTTGFRVGTSKRARTASAF